MHALECERSGMMNWRAGTETITSEKHTMRIADQSAQHALAVLTVQKHTMSCFIKEYCILTFIDINA